MKERSLVLFTLLAQLSVGVFLLLGMLDLQDFSLLSYTLPEIALLFALALLASLFHLGSPGNAYRAANNWRSSWLSREILSSLAFAGSLVLFALLKRQIVFLLAGVCGLALIYCMARVYMLRTVDSWNRLSTPVSFFGAALFLGSLAAGSAVLFFGQETVILPWLGGLALIAFGIETLIWLPAFKNSRPAPIPWSDPLQFQPHPVWRTGFAAMGLLAFESGIFAFSGENTRIILVFFGLAAVYLSEILARGRFYSSRQAQSLF